MDRTSLKEALSRLPETPGVYLFKDDEGRVLYVGKAKDLRTRVSHYFSATGPGPDAPPKIHLLLPRIREIEHLETGSEVEALLLEGKLIKDFQPKYNSMGKDGKTYPLLALTREEFPRVFVTRERDPGAADYYGPYTGATDLHEAVQHLQKVFRFATCRIEFAKERAKRRFFRPCLLHAIKRCSAPCADRISPEDYARDLAALRDVLTGRKQALLASLREEMKAASAAQHYERAAVLRDRVRALEGLERRAKMGTYAEEAPTPLDPLESPKALQEALGLGFLPRTIEGVDIAHLAGTEVVGSLVTFTDGLPFKDGYRRYRIKDLPDNDDVASIREVVGRRFRRLLDEKRDLPHILLIDGGPGQLSAARQALDEVEAGKGPILLALAKKEELIHREDAPPLKLPRNSPALRVLQAVRDEAHRFAGHYHHILRRKSLLGDRSRKSR